MDNRDLCRVVEPCWFYIEMEIMQIVNVKGLFSACMHVCRSRCEWVCDCVDMIEILQTSSYPEQNICAACNNNEIDVVVKNAFKLTEGIHSHN